MAEYIKLEEIKPGSTIKEMVEIINNNFTDIKEHGGGPKGDAGVDGSVGPEGKRGKGIFVIPEEIVGNEGEDYINEILEKDSGSDGEGKYKDGDVIVYKSFLYAVEKNADGTGLVSKCVGSLKGDKGDKGEPGNNGDATGISEGQWNTTEVFGSGGYQFADGYDFLVVGSGISDKTAGEYGINEENGILHSLWVLDGERGIALVGAKNADGIHDKSSISLSADGELVLNGYNKGVVVDKLKFNDGDINSKGKVKIVSPIGIDLNAGEEGSFSANKINIGGGEDITIKSEDYSYGLEEYDGGSIYVSNTGLELSGTGKSISVGISALKGYDVDIVGKTYIDGDLVVSGSVKSGGSMYEIGDLRLWSVNNGMLNGWFDNSVLRSVQQIPILLIKNNTSEIIVTYKMYQELSQNNSLIDIKEEEFNKYSSIGKLIIKGYGYYIEKSLTYGYETPSINSDLLKEAGTFLNSNFKNYIEHNPDFDGTGMIYDLIYSGYRVFTDKNNNSLLVTFILTSEALKSGIIEDMAEVLTKIDTLFSGNEFYDNFSQCEMKISNSIDDFIQKKVTRSSSRWIQRYINGDLTTKYASICIDDFDDNYIYSDEDKIEQEFKYISTDFTLPSTGSNCFKYIAKYEDTITSSATGVGDRKPKSE